MTVVKKPYFNSVMKQQLRDDSYNVVNQSFVICN